MTGKEVVRPDLAGLMGAYGCALVAKKNWNGEETTTLIPKTKLYDFQVKITHSRCGLCENRCPITINRFPDKRTFITGNRCERGAGIQKPKSTLPNLAKEKYENYLTAHPPGGRSGSRENWHPPRFEFI